MSFSLEPFWTYLLAGDLIGFFGALWMSSVGELFYSIIYGSIMILTFGRIESWSGMAIMYLAFAPYMVFMIATAGWGLLSLFIYLSLGGLLFYAVMRTA